jgi:hypothetical protein
MPTAMRRLRILRLALALLLAAPFAVPAWAQTETPIAAIRLLSQTPWTTQKDPLLLLKVRIRNLSDGDIVDPAIVWTIGPKVSSRLQYEAALREGPGSVSSADTIPLTHDLAPGASEVIPIPIDTTQTGGISSDDSGVYPLAVELRSEDQPVASLTTAAINLVQDPPLQPVLFSWWTEVAAPVAFGPDGKLTDLGFESTLATGGGLLAQVAAISDVVRDPSAASAAVDLIVSPAALDQLRQAAHGYTRSDGQSVRADADAPSAAASTLQQLRQIAADPQVHLHAMPFAAPRLPALLGAFPLRPHLATQWTVGDETVEDLMGVRPDPTVARPPGLDFDQASVDELAARGVTTILGAADSVSRPPQPNDFAPPPAALLSTAAGAPIDLVLPDPGAQSLLDDVELRRDPVMAAQAVLGELATIWREIPVDPTIARGLALDLPPDLPGPIWRPLVDRLVAAPFLSPIHAEDLPDAIDPAPLSATLEPPATERFSPSYVNDLFTTARDVSAFASMVQRPDTDAKRLERAILYAEASQYIGNEGSGRAWIDAVNGVTDPTFAGLLPDQTRALTFTSPTGTIPLRMGDPGGRVLNVIVEVASGRVEFLDGRTRTVRIERPNQVVTFDAEVKASGRSSIEVRVRSPNGLVLSQGVLVVRSTALNPIALIITVGAGLVLVGLWSRRLFRRRSS